MTFALGTIALLVLLLPPLTESMKKVVFRKSRAMVEVFILSKKAQIASDMNADIHRCLNIASNIVLSSHNHFAARHWERTVKQKLLLSLR